MLLPSKYEKLFGNGHSFERVMPLKAVDLIKRWEGYLEYPYVDNDGLLHQGYGHGPNAGPPVIVPGQPWTKEYATEVLMDDIRSVSSIVRKWINVPITDYMFGALVSLAYNCGPTRVKEGSKVFQKIGEGNYSRAATEFLNLNTAVINQETKERAVITGLTLRRACEIECYTTQVWK